MTVEIEGQPLFSTGRVQSADEDMWRNCLADRIDAYLATHGIDNLVEACTLRPLQLDTSAVSWSVGAAEDGTAEDGAAEPRIRVAKTIPFHGDPLFFLLAPRAVSLDRPLGIVQDGRLLLAATAPVATFELARAAVERTEQRVRHFTAWQYLEITDANRHLPRMLAERGAVPCAPRRSPLRNRSAPVAATA